MHFKKIFVSVVAVTVAALMISAVSAQCYCECGRSPGYWKHNVKVYNGGPGHYSGDPHESDATMEMYEAAIQVDHPSFTLEWANEMFQNNENKHMWLTIANWFNEAAGYSD